LANYLPGSGQFVAKVSPMSWQRIRDVIDYLGDFASSEILELMARHLQKIKTAPY
jgi:hypothetical protein